MAQAIIKRILDASVYDVAAETPLDVAHTLSARLGSPLLLKREDLQPIFSFKIRGAFNKIRLLADSGVTGVVTASAGNHAQGVAFSARHLGLPACIVMGRATPQIKVDAVARLGARIVLHGDTYDEAAVHATSFATETGFAYVHPFDDLDVIAGQGTVGIEILRQHTGPLSAVFVPVGGGGLIAGVGTYVRYLRPDVKIIGVEAEGAASMTRAVAAKRRVRLSLDTLDLFADGTAVQQVGKESFRLARRCIDEMVTVNVDEICAAVKDVFNDTRVLAEPSGALAVAGAKRHIADHGPMANACVAIVSGANVNFDRLRHISERAESGEQREILLGVAIPEEPGSFLRFANHIGSRAVTEFNYRFDASALTSPARVLVGIQTTDDGDRRELIRSLERRYQVTDLSDNELAVLHVRHMVGGRSVGIAGEQLYRFEFPERPGALLEFLTRLGDRFNITMFHYRNHGAAEGRVLAGIALQRGDRGPFKNLIQSIGYRHWNESDNPAYRMFLD